MSKVIFEVMKNRSEVLFQNVLFGNISQFMSSLVGVRNLTCDKGGMTGVEAAWVGVTVAI